MSEKYIMVTLSFKADDEEHAAHVVRELNDGYFVPLENVGFAVDSALIDGNGLEGWQG